MNFVFHHRSDVDAIVDELVVREPLITTSRLEQVRKLILSILLLYCI